ncbi:MAG: SEC-C domain-containing protein [Archangiaceae bacterium]|nr:SEC-C domain-containing protein [Archangiaceae bacterium]
MAQGRNEPCKCGSGKKFKHCHGAQVRVQGAAGHLPMAIRDLIPIFTHLADLRGVTGQVGTEVGVIVKAQAEKLLEPAALSEFLRYALFDVALPSLHGLTPEAAKDLGTKSWDVFHAVYWCELDMACWWIELRLKKLIGHFMRRLLFGERSIDAAATLRLLIELLIWGAYFQYGVSIGFNSLIGSLKERRPASIVCKALEDFIRGAISHGERRVVAGAVAGDGAGLPPPRNEHTVAEINATVTKQFALVRTMAEQRAEVAPEAPRILDEVELLDDAYSFCCSLTHATSVLLSADERQTDARWVEERFVAVKRRVLSRCAFFLDQTTFNPRGSGQSFWDNIARMIDPKGINAVVESLPQLEGFGRGNASVEFKITGGEPVIAYDSKHGGKRNRRSESP